MLFLVVLFGPVAGAAVASGPVGADPSANYPVGQLPSDCQTDPTGAVCIDASVSYLDRARASLGQPPYSLPSDFASLTPAQQALILTNSDRVLYNLPPITGLTGALDQDAAAGAANDSDPQPSASDWYAYTSNAAWGQENIVVAYEGWMYDDGPGSDNVDCTSLDPSGCWGHRHNILWQFGPGGALAMGAASGTDASGEPSYAMLLVQGSPTYSPAYTHAAAPPIAMGARAAMRIEDVRIRGRRITVRLSGSPTAPLRCSLSRPHGGLLRSKPCRASVTFGHLPAGHYRLRISSSAGSVSRRVVVP